jgi:hypothetical protein
LSRAQAAEYIGVDVTKFDEMVDDGRMPKPKRIARCNRSRGAPEKSGVESLTRSVSEPASSGMR